MKDYFTLTSREHETLPLAELRGVLEAEGIQHTFHRTVPGLIFLKSNSGILKASGRLALTKLLCAHLFTCYNMIGEIRKKISQIDPQKISAKRASFAVRITDILETRSNLNTSVMEVLIGETILKEFKDWKVNLTKPTVEFHGIIWNGQFSFGVKQYQRPRGMFKFRKPSLRPAFHPATLTPKLARIMVNLSRVRADEVMFDPFCGVGGILIEAGLIGCRLVGSDVKHQMCIGALKNLRHYQLNPLAIIQSDSITIPLNSVDTVVTDPPYGTSASTLNRPIRTILDNFLQECYSILTRNRFLCIAAPKTAGIKDLGLDCKFKFIESHCLYIHRSLTREIVVFQK
ncbi:THUMP domain-containing protein [[Eubacterium] cellulosolvens]